MVIISAWGLMAYALWQLNFLKPTFYQCCQYIFLDRASAIGSYISPMAEVYLLAMVIFTALRIGAGQFDIARTYRSVLLLRYRKKSVYIANALQKAFRDVFLVTGMIGSSLLFSYTLMTGKSVFTGSTEEMAVFLCLLLNFFLFFNLMAAVNLFVALAVSGLAALIGVVGSCCFGLIIDAAIQPVSLLTWGTVVQFFGGSGVLVVCLGAVYGLIFYYAGHYDLL